MKQFWEKHREILAYLAFGLISIAVGLSSYLLVFAAAEHWLHVSMTDKTAPAYGLTYVSAQVVQWIMVVLVTFYTNRRWVFPQASRNRRSLWRQLAWFSMSRLFTFALDLTATYGVIHLLGLWLTPDNAPVLLGLKLDAELWAKILVSIFIIVLNYFISKLLVFRKKKQ